MTKFKPYTKKTIAWITPWTPDIDLPMDKVAISQPDRENGSPKEGDMIAINEENFDDMWLIAEKFFNDNYEAFRGQKALLTPVFND